MVRKRGVEPLPLAGLDPKSSASANSATFAMIQAGMRASKDWIVSGCRQDGSW
jgi:hypothetical protein